MILNQVQQTFHTFLLLILEKDLALAWREEIDLLYGKVVLKPALVAEATIEQGKEQTEQEGQEKKQKGPSTGASSETDPRDSGSDLGDDEPELDLLHEDNVSIVNPNINFNLQPSSEKKHAIMRRDIAFDYISEVLLSLSGEQLSIMYLLYDCQPFSESLVSKSI